MSATETVASEAVVADRVQSPAPAPVAGVPAAARTPKEPPKPSKASKPAKSAASAPRTTRVVLRKLDPWSVLKLSLVFYLALFVVILVAGVLLWAGANAVGAVENIESFMRDIGFNDFVFVGSKILGGIALGGLVLVVAGTFANTLLAVLFNLMGDVVGGLKLTLQEDPDSIRTAEGKPPAS